MMLLDAHPGVIQLTAATLDDGGLRLVWADDHTALLDPLWLRHHCPCGVDRPTGQRMVDVADFPADLAIRRVESSASSDEADGDRLAIHWSDDRQSTYSASWLRRLCDPAAVPSPAGPVLVDAARWERLGIPRVDGLDFLAEDETVFDALVHLRDLGFAVLEGVPRCIGMLEQVVARVGYIRETNYGRLFDVRTIAQPNHPAYTPIGLDPHTDNPYRGPVPGYQALHCLTPAGEGGESVLVDGFAVAERLRAESPQGFELLSQVELDFRFRDAVCDLRGRGRIIDCDDDGQVRRIRFNGRSVVPPRLPLAESRAFYAAYRRFSELLRDSEVRVEFLLGAGDVLLFDNERMLHGRQPFRLDEGERHLQGCYFDRDAVSSRLRLLAERYAPPAADPGLPGGAGRERLGAWVALDA